MNYLDSIDSAPSVGQHLQDGNAAMNSVLKEYNRKARLQRAKMLIHFLPFGVVSKQAFLFLAHGDSSTCYHMVRRKYVEKGSIEHRDPDRKRDAIYYSITTKGLKYILNSGIFIPEWIRDLTVPSRLSQWGDMTKFNFLRFVEMQDAIAFFTLADVPTLLTELWKGSVYALTVMIGMRNNISGDSKNMILDLLIKSLLSHYERYQIIENTLYLHLRSFYDNGDMEPETVEGFFPYPMNRRCYADLREVNCVSQVIRGEDTKNPNTLRDNCIGILSGPYQDISVYLTSRYGIKYSSRLAKTSNSFNRICASRISNNPSRALNHRCTSIIVLCRNEREMARAVFDPLHIRRFTNTELGEIYEHVYLVPFSEDGLRMVPDIMNVNPDMSIESRGDELADLAELFSDLTFQSGYLKKVSTGTICFNGMDFDAKTIYEASQYAESSGEPLLLICEEWQRSYYRAILEAWSRATREEHDSSEIRLALRTVKIEYEMKPTKWEQMLFQDYGHCAEV